MRSLIRLLLALLPALACAGQAVHITLLHVNDVYQISPVDNGTRGGLARLAALKKQVQAESPHTLLLFGGDTLSPSVASNTFRGEQMIAAWNATGLDMAVFGNHEFDFGPDILQARMAESHFPWLGANVHDKTGNALFANARASEIRTFDGIKIGFLGVVTPSTAQSSRPGPQLRFDDANIEARREAGRLRAKGAMAVVALTHQDLAQDRKLAETGAVDLILGGHDHVLMQTLAGRTPIFKAGSDARLVARLDLYLDRDSRRLTHLDWEMLPLDARTPEDADAARVVAGFENRLSALLDQPVGETSVALDARQEPSRSRETNVGDWLADIYRNRTGAEAAIVNGGTIRSNAGYGPGKLSRRDILSILPFENLIVKLDVSGRILRAALEHGLSEIHESRESGRFPQVSGIRYVYDPRLPVGNRLTQVTVNGAPLEDDRRYALAVNTYLAGGGDGYKMFKGQTFLITPENALSETAEVIEALTAGSPVAPRLDGRIKSLP
ncbi:MAG: 5'-nucleotidase C-terminal domain-containing protein [Rhodocyclaceae bacterium]|nr:5'-nucleotidase C-terminal domain-containing protein [Rhodocyclaceae bacterium]